MILYMFQCHYSQIIPPSPSPTESKRLFYTSVSLLLSRIQGYCYHLSKFHIYALVYCIGVFLSGLLHSTRTFKIVYVTTAMATHSSVLALRIPGMGLPGMGYSCFENPRWAAIYGVTQSRTRLKRLSSSSNAYTWNLERWQQ